MNEARIKLAEARGWRNVGEQYGKAPGEDTYSLYPDPFTDANDDVAVLEWAHEQADSFQSGFQMALSDIRTFEMDERTWSISGESWNYKIGDYARAACKVLGIEVLVK